MIIFFSFLTNHKDIIKEKGAAHCGGIDNFYVLIFGFFVEQHLFVGNAEPWKESLLVDPRLGHQLFRLYFFASVLGVDEQVSGFLDLLRRYLQVLDKPSGDECTFAVQALQPILQDFHTFERFHFGGACENINSGIPEFGPGMNSHVGLGNNYDTADSKGIEVMELGADDGSITDLSTFEEILLDLGGVVEALEFAVVEFCNVVLSQE